jgi:hypothetical protein
LKRNKEFHNIPLLSVLETIGRDSTTTPRVFLSPPLQKKRKDPSSCEKKEGSLPSIYPPSALT